MAGEWREARLSDVCKEIYRYPSFYGMEKHDHGIPVVRGEHLLASGQISTDWSDYWFVSEEYAQQFPKTRLAIHDVVMSVRGSIGTFARVGSAHVGAQLSPNLIRLSPDPDKIEPAFFYYALKGSAAQGFITSTSSSSAVPAIRAADIKIAEIPLPPRHEQRAIAHILGTLDDKIELNRRMSETLEAMARALFKSWFVDFEPVRAKMEGRWQRGNPLPPLPLGEGRGEGSLPTKSHARLPSDLLAFARELRQNETDAERLLWRLLRNRSLAGAKFRRQHPFPPYVLDFYCHELKLAIELDGGQHNLPEGRLHDKVRRRNWRSTESASFVFGITRCCATPRACWKPSTKRSLNAGRSYGPHPQPLSLQERGAWFPASPPTSTTSSPTVWWTRSWGRSRRGGK